MMPTNSNSILNGITNSNSNLIGLNLTSTGTLTTASSPWTTQTYPGTGNMLVGNSYNYGSYSGNWTNPLKKLDYTAIFEIDDKDEYLLSSNISGIKKNKFLFNCDYVGNRIQPYELIMNLIEKETKFSVKIKISNILTICYTNLQFTKIINNFDFDKECDFSELKVKFIYERIEFENHKLSKKESRSDKLKKLVSQE